jgi:hypothetical protein
VRFQLSLEWEGATPSKSCCEDLSMLVSSHQPCSLGIKGISTHVAPQSAALWLQLMIVCPKSPLQAWIRGSSDSSLSCNLQSLFGRVHADAPVLGESRSASIMAPLLFPVSAAATLTFPASVLDKWLSCGLGCAEHCELRKSRSQTWSRGTLKLEMNLLLLSSPALWTTPCTATVASSCSWKVVELGSHSGSSKVRVNCRQLAGSNWVDLQAGKQEVMPRSPKGIQCSFFSVI